MLTRKDGDPDFVKVLDFGLAKLSAGVLPGEQRATADQLTQVGEIFGTPPYMAPEQTTGAPTDGRTDLYALGMILYEMLAGRLAFDGQDVTDFIRHHLSTPLPPLGQRAPGVSVPESVEALVRRLCQKPPPARFQNAEEFIEALLAAAKEHQLVLTPPKVRSSSPGTGDSNSGVQPLAAALKGPAQSPPGTPTALPQTASMVMFLAAVGRAQKRLSGRLQKISKERLAGLLALLGLVLFGIVYTAIWALRGSSSDSDGDNATPEKAQPAAAVAQDPSPAELAAASASGTAALQQLASKYPGSAETLHALAVAEIRQGQAGPALSTIGKLAHKGPSLVEDPELSKFVSAQLLSGREEQADAARRVIEQDFGDKGVDLLLKLADSVPPRSRARINLSLNNLRTHSDLSPATQALLELRAAGKCEQKHAALPRVRQFGDARSLPLLYALQTPTGCAPFGLGDCWACLRQSKDLDDTIKAVADRAGESGVPSQATAAESKEE